MSKDYKSVAGLGVYMDEKMISAILEGDPSEVNDSMLQEVFGESSYVRFFDYGDCWSGTGCGTIMVVAGETLDDLQKNLPGFLAKVREKGINLEAKDLSIVHGYVIT